MLTVVIELFVISRHILRVRFWIVFVITRTSLNRGSLSPKFCLIHFIEILARLEKISLIFEVPLSRNTSLYFYSSLSFHYDNCEGSVC